MGSSDDLSTVWPDQEVPRLVMGQGEIISWDRDTFENEVLWNGTILRDLPVVKTTAMLTFQKNETVILIGHDSGGGRGVSSWFIVGGLLVPGGTEDSQGFIFDILTARVVNADVVNSDSVNIQGQTTTEVQEESAPPPVGTIKVTYDASWSANYRGISGLPRNTFDERPHQGQWSSTNGNQRSLIGFPSSVQSDHGGRTVNRARVFLRFTHWYWNSGGTAVLGHHGHSSRPSSFSATTDTQRSGSWPNPGSRWVTYSHTPQQWATGTKRGIALGPGPSINKLYYGRAQGVNQSNSPRLEVRSTG